MRETKKKAIGDRGHVYHVTQFGARHGMRVAIRLAKMIGGAAGAALAADEEGFDAKVVGAIIANLAETVSEADFDFLCDEFGKATSVSGGEYGDRTIALDADGLFDLHFAGQYVELGSWLVFAVEVNFGGFLAVAAQAKGAAIDARPASPQAVAPNGSSSKSPNGSPTLGRSGV